MPVVKSNQISFDDVWLVPQYSEVESRRDPVLSSKLSAYHELSHPVIATNMASVVGENMASLFDRTGSIAIRHRFMTKAELENSARNFIDTNGKLFAFSVGIKDEDYDIASSVYDIVGDKAVILIDIAHGHTKRMGAMTEKIKNIGYKTVISGNIATADGYSYLSSYGADSVRVGVAGGRVCTTKHVTGHHVPTLQSVIECAEFRDSYKLNSTIIADGGIASSGDAVKCLAAGADFVCIGSLLAPTSESPSELITDSDGSMFKIHYGMSSKQAINTFFGVSKRHVAAEGKTERLHYAGETADFLDEFLSGIKSALTYSGCFNISEFQTKAILRLAVKK